MCLIFPSIILLAVSLHCLPGDGVSERRSVNCGDFALINPSLSCLSHLISCKISEGLKDDIIILLID